MWFLGNGVAGLAVAARLMLLVVVVSVLGCSKPQAALQPAFDETEVVHESADLHPKVVAEFIRFDEDDVAGRVADFTLTNGSDCTIVGFRGDITAVNAKGEVVYEFPWSTFKTPHLVDAGGTTTLDKAGYKIPEEAVSATLVFSEFDIKVESKK